MSQKYFPENYNCVVILGPTAVGKTGVGVGVADYYNGQIISADSRQVYKGLDIGSGKDLDEYILDKGKSTERKIPYHLIFMAADLIPKFEFENSTVLRYMAIISSLV